MTRLKEIYEEYYENVARVRRKAFPLAGVWGIGEDPRKHPCHDDFYEAVRAWVTAFAAENPAPDAALEVVRWILEAGLTHRDPDVYWYLYAAHGLVMPLIPKLRGEDCRALAQWYDVHYPKKERLPVHQNLFKALKKAGK